MIKLITLAQAKRQTYNTDNTDHDEDLDFKIDLCSGIALEYCKVVLGSPETLPWDTVPAVIQAAVMQMVGEAWANREASTTNLLSDSVKGLLDFYRVPTSA